MLLGSRLPQDWPTDTQRPRRPSVESQQPELHGVVLSQKAPKPPSSPGMPPPPPPEPPTQAPASAASQVCPPEHPTHACPAWPVPHCELEKLPGSTQLLPSQQPAQVCALQVVPP